MTPAPPPDPLFVPPFATPLPAIDRVVRVDGAGRRLLATKVVVATDPYMPGHFPDLPLYPAVFLVETVLQAVAAAGAAYEFPEVRAIRSARLLAPMLGGTELSVEIRIGDRAGPAPFEVKAVCTRSDGVRAATMTLLLADGDGVPTAAVRGPGPARPVGAALDHAAIIGLLPVRHPMVLVDRAEAVEPGRAIRAVKTVSGSEPCYGRLPEGLPPQRYAYPSSLVFESFGQAAAVLWVQSAGGRIDGADGVLMLAAMRDCHVESRAFPGDVLRHTIRLEQEKQGTAFLSGETWVDDRRIAVLGSLIAVQRPTAAVNGVTAAAAG